MNKRKAESVVCLIDENPAPSLEIVQQRCAKSARKATRVEGTTRTKVRKEHPIEIHSQAKFRRVSYPDAPKCKGLPLDVWRLIVALVLEETRDGRAVIPQVSKAFERIYRDSARERFSLFLQSARGRRFTAGCILFRLLEEGLIFRISLDPGVQFFGTDPEDVRESEKKLVSGQGAKNWGVNVGLCEFACYCSTRYSLEQEWPEMNVVVVGRCGRQRQHVKGWWSPTRRQVYKVLPFMTRKYRRTWSISMSSRIHFAASEETHIAPLLSLFLDCFTTISVDECLENITLEIMVGDISASLRKVDESLLFSVLSDLEPEIGKMW